MAESYSKRSPSTAAMLSMLSTGLGHIYCGRLAAGLALFFSTLLPVPFAVAAAFLQSPTRISLGSCPALLIRGGRVLLCDRRQLPVGQKADEHYELKEYNRCIVYALFVAAGIVYASVVMMHIRTNVFEAFYCPARA